MRVGASGATWCLGSRRGHLVGGAALGADEARLRWSCAADVNKTHIRIRGTMKVREISKESPGKQIGVVSTCDAKRGALRRKTGDRNKRIREEEESKV